MFLGLIAVFLSQSVQAHNFSETGYRYPVDFATWWRNTPDETKELAGRIYGEASGFATAEQSPNMSKAGELPSGYALASAMDKWLAYSQIALTALCREEQGFPMKMHSPVDLKDLDQRNRFVENSVRFAALSATEMTEYFEELGMRNLDWRQSICRTNKHFWMECFRFSTLGPVTWQSDEWGPQDVAFIDQLKADHTIWKEAGETATEQGLVPTYTSIPFRAAGDETVRLFFEPTRGYCRLYFPLVAVKE